MESSKTTLPFSYCDPADVQESDSDEESVTAPPYSPFSVTTLGDSLCMESPNSDDSHTEEERDECDAEQNPSHMSTLQIV